ncbi:hypothetical protein [Agromyces sp. PvR057]|uniref:hypothetical protein n=1 Tax=Agromyces sp. PvR057 TaxID=3156403 RepID=UPI00339B6CCA
MNRSRVHNPFALVAAVLLCAGLSACGAGGSSNSTGSTQPAAETEMVEAPADLTGEWVQTNSESEDSYQSATITADTIEVYWVSDGGSTTALYWAGTFEAPTEAGPYSWDSLNDIEKTGASMLASGDPTKTFTYDADVLSYEVTALGVTKTVELGRE